MIYNVLIVGAGNIGALYDMPNAKQILTHAHAFTLVENFRLVGFADANIQRAQHACDVWGGSPYLKISDAILQEHIDLVCIAVPDELHYAILLEAIHHNIPYILLEKPFTKTIAQATDALKLLEQKQNIQVMVNYSRRYVPEFINIKHDIEAGVYGKFLKGCGYYGKGFLHNGSHMVDLVRYWLGDPQSIISHGKEYDYYNDDPTVDASLVFPQNEQFEMMGINQSHYTVFEVDLFFEKRRIRMVDGGLEIEIYDIANDPLFGGYKKLTKIQHIYTSVDTSVYYVATHAYKVMQKEITPFCDAKEAFKDMLFCLEQSTI